MQRYTGLNDELEVLSERQRGVKEISQICSMNNWVNDEFDDKRKYIWRKVISSVLDMV